MGIDSESLIERDRRRHYALAGPGPRPCDAPENSAKRQRARLTNGRKFLANVDGRSPWVRRAKDILRFYFSDIPDASAAERAILKRASILEVELEFMESKFALREGDVPIEELDAYARIAGNHRRLLEAIGLKRRQLDITPSLTEYVNRAYDAEPATDAEPVP